jgi:hypothetical protein
MSRETPVGPEGSAQLRGMAAWQQTTTVLT